jgi:hypothetical protein
MKDHNHQTTCIVCGKASPPAKGVTISASGDRRWSLVFRDSDTIVDLVFASRSRRRNLTLAPAVRGLPTTARSTPNELLSRVIR